MTEAASQSESGHRVRGASADSIQSTRAKEAGPKFEWHYGRVTRLGSFAIGGNREVTIVWEEGGVAAQQGDITDEQWEIFKLAFLSSGRVAVLSDHQDEGWMYDYRFLEAVR